MSTTPPAESTFPASPIQRQIWEQCGDVCEHQVKAELLVRGPVTVADVAAAFADVVRRQEILRTRLRLTPDGLEQVVRITGDEFHLEDSDFVRARWTQDNAGVRLHLQLSAAVADATTVELIAVDLAAALAGEAPQPKLQHGDIAQWLVNSWHREESSLGPGRCAVEGVRSFSGDEVEAQIPEVTVAALEDLARAARAPAEAAWLACWRSLVGRAFAKGSETFCVALDGRSDDALHDALGPLTGMVALNIEWAPGCEVETAVRATADWLRDARPMLLRQTSAPAAGIGFVLRVAHGPQAAGDVVVEVVQLEDHSRPCKIELSCVRHPAGASIRVRWDSRADAELAAKLPQWFAALAGCAAQIRTAPLDSFPLACPATYRSAAAALDGGPTRAAGLLAHHQFEAVTLRTPDAIAVIDADEAISYGKLNERSNRLANHLRAAGVNCGDIVAILLDRSIDEVVSVLAALKAGAAFLLLDPRSPQERIRKILETDHIPVVLTHAALAPLIDPSPSRIVALDAGADEIAQRSSTAPNVDLSDDAPAYVVYTSGSTGVPKAGINTHLSTCNLLAWMERQMHITTHHRFLRKTPGGFDAGVWELLLPLSTGAMLVIAPPLAHQDMSVMTELIRRYAINVVHFVPSMLKAFVEDPGIGGCGSLAFVLCGGERLTLAVRNDLRARLPGATLLHFYGPSETGVDTTYWRDPGEWTERIPIGRPLEGVRLRIVDNAGNDAPPGMPGEVLISGSGVGIGYHRRPALTAERFLPDPYGVPGRRCYRSGDVVRLRADGALDFLGRSDQQMKLGGVRLEAGEVEAAIQAIPGVRQAAVLLRAGPDGAQILTAFVVLEAGANRSPARFRATLATMLPQAMIPSQWVFPEALPKLPSGKLDRRALAEQPLPVEDSNPNRLSSMVQDTLAALWQRLFPCDALSPESSFFESGGSSIAAIRLVGLVNEVLGVRLSIASIFAHPRLGELAGIIEDLMGRGHARESVPRARPDGPRRLSLAQEQLWLLQQVDPENTAYNVVEGLRLRGVLDVYALRRALDALVKRHEILATTIRGTLETPCVESHSATAMPFSIEEFPITPPERALAEVVARAAATPFRLDTELPVRAVLLKFADDDHALVLSLHHIVCDDASLMILLREALGTYEAVVGGWFEPPVPLRIQYVDFAEWQRTRLAGVLEDQLKYWKERLAPPLPKLQLPAECPAGSAPPQYRRLSRTLPAELREAVVSLGRSLGATPFVVSCAAYATVLGRVCREDKIIIGTPVDNRDHEGLDELIGLFVNLLPLAIDLSGNPSFTQVVTRTRTATIGAIANREAPFQMIVSAVAPERDRNTLPLLRVGFVQYERVRPPLTARGLEIEVIDTAHAMTKMDLLFTIDATGNEWSAVLEYDGARVNDATINSILNAWVTVLKTAAADPQVPAQAISLVDESEQLALVRQWNPAAEAMCGPGLVSRFLQISAAWSDRIAVQFDDGAFTYGELAARAAGVANWLRAVGAGPESPVAVLLEPSAQLAAAILGIVQAGCAFVPLRPSEPPLRIEKILSDVGARFVLTTTDEPTAIPPDVITIPCEECVAAAPAIGAMPDPPAAALACVLYTSGSTGEPKGVAVTHGAILRLVCGQQEVQVTADDRMAQLADPSFDAFLFELWATLVSGARLVGIAREEIIDPPVFAARLREESITVAFITAALLQHTAGVVPGAFGSMRVLIFGGEVVDPPVIRTIRQNEAPQQLVHAYGPTEATTFSTWGSIDEMTPGPRLPLGRPLIGTRVHVLDHNLEPCPIGIPGELYIGGDGLARGYAGKAALTAERFIPDPFGPVGERLYGTGDIGHRLEDGSLEFLGRRDDQVKIRGHRIEPSEVAVVLRQHPGVSDACVVTIDEETGRALTAHLVARNGPVSRGELMMFLRSRLPSYMAPAKVFWHDSLPLTPHGKVDRSALAQLAVEQAPEPALTEEAPKTPTEQLVAEVWSGVLGTPVGRYDDFFDSGGHSLLASQIAARLGNRTGIAIPLKLIFECRTPSAFAAAIELRREILATAPPPPRSHTTEQEISPLALQQEHVWLLEQLFPNHTFFHVNVTCRIDGPLDIKRFEGALHALALRHDALRTTFTFDDTTGPKQRISRAPIVEFLVTAVSSAEEARLTIAEAVKRPFNLESGPLWRVMLVRQAPDAHVLVVSIHHVICDGVSLDLLSRELGAIYRSDTLPEVHMQYGDFVRWQHEHLLPERLPQQMSYWREQLEGEMKPLPLGGQTGRSDLEFHMQTVQTQCDPELSRRFRSAIARSGATPFSSLLAVLALGLRRLTGHTDLRIATLLANRGRMELENVVGLLTNLVVLRLRMLPEDSSETTLRRATQTVLGAFENGELPFEQMIAELQSTQTIERGLLAPIMLLVEENNPTTLEIPGLTVVPYDDDEETKARVSLSGHDCIMLGAWRAEGLMLTLQYKESAMDSSSALRLLDFMTEEIKALSVEIENHG